MASPSDGDEMALTHLRASRRWRSAGCSPSLPTTATPTPTSSAEGSSRRNRTSVTGSSRRSAGTPSCAPSSNWASELRRRPRPRCRQRPRLGDRRPRLRPGIWALIVSEWENASRPETDRTQIGGQRSDTRARPARLRRSARAGDRPAAMIRCTEPTVPGPLARCGSASNSAATSPSFSVRTASRVVGQLSSPKAPPRQSAPRRPPPPAPAPAGRPWCARRRRA